MTKEQIQFYKELCEEVYGSYEDVKKEKHMVPESITNNNILFAGSFCNEKLWIITDITKPELGQYVRQFRELHGRYNITKDRCLEYLKNKGIQCEEAFKEYGEAS